jgi:hypothetical protein
MAHFAHEIAMHSARFGHRRKSFANSWFIERRSHVPGHLRFGWVSIEAIKAGAMKSKKIVVDIVSPQMGRRRAVERL